MRLDKLLVERGFAPTRARAQALIMTGNVLVEEEVIDKAGALIAPDRVIRLRGDKNPYVSRGGLKLKGALEYFGITVRGLVALDVGASTGGFTDCLLQEGAARVYALDVGYGQLAWKLREDKRVIVIERMNIRLFDGAGIAEDIGIATIDTSFISLKLVIPVVSRFIAQDAILLALIKPQFEVGKGKVGKGGLVKDPCQHQEVIEDIIQFCHASGFSVSGTCPSPLTGPAGNREFFLYATKSEGEKRCMTVRDDKP